MSEGGQQRAFANRIKLQSAQQIRQSATAAVKAATEKVRTYIQGLMDVAQLVYHHDFPIYYQTKKCRREMFTYLVLALQ